MAPAQGWAKSWRKGSYLLQPDLSVSQAAVAPGPASSPLHSVCLPSGRQASPKGYPANTQSWRPQEWCPDHIHLGTSTATAAALTS